MNYDYRDEIIAIAERVCPPRFGMQDDWEKVLFDGGPTVIDATEAICVAMWLEDDAAEDRDIHSEDDYIEIARQIRELVTKEK